MNPRVPNFALRTPTSTAATVPVAAIVMSRVFLETFGTSVACQGADLELRDIRPPRRWPGKRVPMTATLITAGETLEREQNAEFRLSSRHRGMLRTLNTLFDELSPPAITEEDFLDSLRSPLNAVDVSRVVRS